MKRSLASALILAACSLHAEPPILQEARRALEESIPQVAIHKLRTFLAGSESTQHESRGALLQLAESLLAANQPAEALATIQPLLVKADSDVRILNAHILAALGRWNEALPIYRSLAALPDAGAAPRLGEVESLQALGETSKAIEILTPFCRTNPENLTARLRLASLRVEMRDTKKARAELATLRPLSPAEMRWKSYIEGRLLLLQDQPAPALVIFQELVAHQEGLPENLLVGATLGIAEARIVMNGYDVADAVLEDFIWKHPNSALLDLVFRRLDQVYAHQDKPSESVLKRFVQEGPPRRAALARFYQARMQARARKPDRAAWSLEQFVQNFPRDPLVPYAFLMQADLLLENRDLPGAVRALEAAMRDAKNDEHRAEIELRTALVHYQQGEFLLAANFFERAGNRSEKLRQQALFGSGLSWLNQRNDERFFQNYRELSRRWPESPLRAELILEKGLVQARTKDPSAPDTLQLFLHDFPQAVREPEARLALAELAFESGDMAGATRYLRVANETPLASTGTEQAEYLKLFLADAESPRDEQKVIELGLRFTREHSRSALLPQVRMKLGQIYFHREDFSNAETQFAVLAQESPLSPYVETALFLAGQSAVKTINPDAIDRALGLFERVVNRGGPLKLYARQQQAIVQSKLGKEMEAMTLYDNILAAQPPPDAELRFAALGGKGENLLALGRRDPKQLEAAIAVFDQLANLPEVTPPWRNQALYKKAKALEQLERTPEALTAYYDVLERSNPVPAIPNGEGREYFWYYKAGFDAARIFEQQEQWKSAIGVYEKMSKVDGPLSGETRERVKELRLKQFIWE